MTEKTDPLAENAARNALADLIYHSNVDLSEDGCGSPEDNAGHLAELAARAHTVTWERQVNIDPGDKSDRGTPGNPNIYVRRYVLRSGWEIDPEGEAYFTAMEKQLVAIREELRNTVPTPRCLDRECPHFGDQDFGDGTCPADHALTPAQHAQVADELGQARRAGYAEALRAAAEAFSVQQEDNWGASAVIEAVAERLGVTL